MQNTFKRRMLELKILLKFPYEYKRTLEIFDKINLINSMRLAINAFFTLHKCVNFALILNLFCYIAVFYNDFTQLFNIYLIHAR